MADSCRVNEAPQDSSERFVTLTTVAQPAIVKTIPKPNVQEPRAAYADPALHSTLWMEGIVIAISSIAQPDPYCPGGTKPMSVMAAPWTGG